MANHVISDFFRIYWCIFASLSITFEKGDTVSFLEQQFSEFYIWNHTVYKVEAKWHNNDSHLYN
jgi:hypothetical protein